MTYPCKPAESWPVVNRFCEQVREFGHKGISLKVLVGMTADGRLVTPHMIHDLDKKLLFSHSFAECQSNLGEYIGKRFLYKVANPEIRYKDLVTLACNHEASTLPRPETLRPLPNRQASKVMATPMVTAETPPYAPVQANRYIATSTTNIDTNTILPFYQPSNRSSIIIQKQLEYRFLPDHARVSDKIERANQYAATQGEKEAGSTSACLINPEFTLTPDQPLVPQLTTGTFPLYPGSGFAAACGKKATMEDLHTVGCLEFKVREQNEQALYVGVFDGHSSRSDETTDGLKAARYAANRLEAVLKNRLEEFNPAGLTEAGIWNALKLAMVDLDRQPGFFLADTIRAGTTANIALTIGDRLWVTNVGDSRAILVFPDGRYLQLSEDAKPARTATGDMNRYARSATKRLGTFEGNRIKGQCHGNLSTARALGDHHTGEVISARPKITCYPLKEVRDSLLIQGSDGIFDVASPNLISQLVQRHPDITNEEMAQTILCACYAAGSTDNMTVTLVPLSGLQ